MIPYNQLTAIDVNILKYLLANRHRKIHFHEVLEEFNSFKSIEFRITLFSTPDRKPFPYGAIPNTSYIRFHYETIRSDEGISQTHQTPFISITELGIKAIEDYDFDYAERRKIRLEDRILRIVPIGISLMTKKAIPAAANFVKSSCIADIRIAKLAYSDILTNFHAVALVMGLSCRGSFFVSINPPSNPFDPF